MFYTVQEKGQEPRGVLTVLVDEHANGDAAHVQAVQKVLNVLTCHRICPERVSILDDTLCHGWYHVIVPVPNGHQSFHKSFGENDKTT